jgi:hypothetical protein
VAESRPADVVRREIGLEREALAGALERLRVETTGVKHAVRRRAARAAAVLVVVGAALAAVRVLVGRIKH